jgi:hypothetical protein
MAIKHYTNVSKDRIELVKEILNRPKLYYFTEDGYINDYQYLIYRITSVLIISENKSKITKIIQSIINNKYIYSKEFKVYLIRVIIKIQDIIEKRI